MHTRNAYIYVGVAHRVRHINHLREKWSGKPKLMTPVRSFEGSAASSSSPSSSSSTMMALRKMKKLHTSSKMANDSESETDREPVDFDKRRRRALSMMDMERYHTLSSWLEQNGIDIPHQHAHRRHQKFQAGATVFDQSMKMPQSPMAKVDLFDDVYDSLEMLEKTVESEILQLDSSHPSPEQQMCRGDENKVSAHDGNCVPRKHTRA